MSEKTISEALVRFIEFKRPNGEQVECHIARPKPIAEMAAWLWDNGYRLTAELIPYVNKVALVSDHPDREEDVAAKVCPNDGAMDGAVDALIGETYRIAKDREVQ